MRIYTELWEEGGMAFPDKYRSQIGRNAAGKSIWKHSQGWNQRNPSLIQKEDVLIQKVKLATKWGQGRNPKPVTIYLEMCLETPTNNLRVHGKIVQSDLPWTSVHKLQTEQNAS